ncbi:hypothetical protein I4U23_005621 [Adineta vaga]|nr:hypothetical protein I4U23_005621 [Adineta vaga]
MSIGLAHEQYGVGVGVNVLINRLSNQRAILCSWIGHCICDPCSTYNDCDESFICSNGKCSNSNVGGGGGVENTTCKSSGVLYVQLVLLIICQHVVNFEQGGAGACFGLFYSDFHQVVALSTGWYNKGSRCGKMITIHGNGKTTKAMVVDECDSVHGCDKMYAGQPPCRNNIVDGSPPVWAALKISKNDPRYGQINIFISKIIFSLRKSKSKDFVSLY